MIILRTVIFVVAYIVLAPIIGGLLTGIDRKLTARMQGRVGPPVLQPFYDVLKLREKEDISVNKYQDFYVIGFLLFVIVTGSMFFAGFDLLLVIFTLTLANVFLIVGAFSSNSPYTQIGAERELLQMMAYEPMVLLVAVGMYLCCGKFDVETIFLSAEMPFFRLIGIFVGFVFILTIKFRKSPFDLSMSHHAHQELVRGLTTEFSGKTMAHIEVAHWYENMFLLGFVFLFFCNNTWWGYVVGVLVCLATYFLEIVIDNCYARMKWQIALNSAWIVTLILGVTNVFMIYIIG